MNTIVRSINGKVNVLHTVSATVKVLKTQSGYISIYRIQNAINDQLPDTEYMSRTIVVRALATILDVNGNLVRK